MEPALLGSPPSRLPSCSLGKTLLQAHPHLHKFSLLPPKQLLCPRGRFLSCFSPVSFSSKPCPRIFMSWIKPPSFLQLPAQCLGNLLPNLLATKAKKTLQNTDDQKQSAVMLPFLAYAPWQHVSAKDSPKEAFCKSCPASFPPKFRWKPPMLRVQVEGSVKPWQGSRESFSLRIRLLLLVFHAAQSPPIRFSIVLGENRSNPPVCGSV